MSSAHEVGSKEGGFTLIEVLVALVIVAVGMAALMGALSSSARTVVYMQDKTFAEWVALNQITSVRIQLQRGQTPPVGKTNGDVLAFGNRDWHWAQEVVASQVPGIMRIDVKVRPKLPGTSSANDDDNANWYVTVSGIAGNALAAPGTGNVLWNGSNPLGQGVGGGANQGTNLGGNSNSSNGPGSPGSGTGTGAGSGTGTGTGTGPGTGPTNK